MIPVVGYHPTWQLRLTEYVDDFNMSDPVQYMEVAWKELHTHSDIEDTAGANLYLGCKQKMSDLKSKDVLVKNGLICYE